MLNGIDVLVYDLQDVGVRFYTFTTTLAFVLETCAEYNLPLIVLDRPNPITGALIEGPLLNPARRSWSAVQSGYAPMLAGRRAR